MCHFQWNETIRLFRGGMPLRRHWLHFRSYDNSFTGSEGIDWLHELLKRNHNFGPEVTRYQALQLLGKFLKNHVIEDVKGRFGKEDFEDNGHLYRWLFCTILWHFWTTVSAQTGYFKSFALFASKHFIVTMNRIIISTRCSDLTEPEPQDRFRCKWSIAYFHLILCVTVCYISVTVIIVVVVVTL